MAEPRPLVLDVDGTLLRTDLLYESFWASLGRAPAATLRASLAHLTRREVLKRELADLAELRTDLMPVQPEMLEIARTALAEGREVVLASASDRELVEAVAHDHGLSPRVFASTTDVNLRGAAKAEALVETFGEGGFDYAGNEPADRAIWAHSHEALIVGEHPRLAAEMRAAGKPVIEIAERWRKRDLIRALRPHQWVKNVLLFVPLIAAHEFQLAAFLSVLLGIIAFSAAASAIYIVNDLLDLEADRLHATKHRRPFASGAVPIKVGMAACAGLIAIALGIGTLLGSTFLWVVAFYMALSLAYSLRFKAMRWVDIATLAALYTLRVIAGAAAVDVSVTGYLLAFIFPAFLTLGCVKRLTEVTLAQGDERLPGRGYGRLDRGDLLNVAGLGAVATLLIFFLYSFSPHALQLYPTQWLLWVAMIPLAGWLLRMVWLGHAGKQDYDPIVFAMRDKFGIGLILIQLSIMFYAAGLWQEWFGV